ncbi:putative gustatory receptor 28b [Vespula maculifrons]|uniref:Gustatory receptor 28b n=1 Tax=Vespula maculifrons TaxID=7453 RepID=A0ABD2CP35_VESMC
MVIFIIPTLGLYHSQTKKLYAKRINEIDKTLQTLGSSASLNNWILEDQEIYKSIVMYYAIFLHVYSFMVKFISVFEFVTIIRCLKSEFQRANELLSDINILPISSIASELIEHKQADGSFLIERSLPVDSKKLFTALPSLRQAHSQMQIASLRINRSRMLLRTIR